VLILYDRREIVMNNDSLTKENFEDTLNQIRNLLKLDAGWNGYDSLAPNPDAVTHAEHWIVRLFREVADLGQVWIKPNVIADAEGEVVFEWWNGQKKLMVYIGDESAEYMQVWGTDIHSEISDGDAEPVSICRSLWPWLTN
jgi:hypothetical protein